MPRPAKENPYFLDIDGLRVQVTRKRVKNLNIRIVPPDGEVKVSASPYISDAAIRRFVQERANWIAKSQFKIRAVAREKERMSALSKTKQFLDGETIFVWGKPYTIVTQVGGRWGLTVDDAGVNAISRNTEHVHRVTTEHAHRVTAEHAQAIAHFKITKKSSVESRQKFLKRWYSDETVRVAKKFLFKWETTTGLRAKDLRAIFMKSRWGTCNTRDKKITLNSQLAVFDVKYLDYVVLHELAHIKVPNHGPKFYSFLDEHLKNWKQLRKELNDFSV